MRIGWTIASTDAWRSSRGCSRGRRKPMHQALGIRIRMPIDVATRFVTWIAAGSESERCACEKIELEQRRTSGANQTERFPLVRATEYRRVRLHQGQESASLEPQRKVRTDRYSHPEPERRREAVVLAPNGRTRAQARDSDTRKDIGLQSRPDCQQRRAPDLQIFDIDLGRGECGAPQHRGLARVQQLV